MKVLAVASEVFPLVKTGGLADVVGALPRALAKQGVEVRTLLPGYPAVMDALADAEPVHAMAALHGGAARVLAATVAGLALFVLDAPHLFARPGNPYQGPGRCRLARQRPALRRLGPGRRRYRARRRAGLGADGGALPRLAGGVGAGLSRPRGGCAAAHGHDDPQPRLHRPGPDGAVARVGAAAGGAGNRGRRVLRRDRLHEGRAVLCRRDHHRQPELRGGNPDAGLRLRL